MSKDYEYDVIIIGAGPSGIFASMELIKNKDVKILLIDKGFHLSKRECKSQAEQRECIRCQPCAITCGWGGAGAFSDGKLTLTASFGGLLNEYLAPAILDNYIEEIDAIYLKFGAGDVIFGQDDQAIGKMYRLAAASGLSLMPAKIRHMGTENCYHILKKMHDYLTDKVDIRMNTSVSEIISRDNKAQGVRLTSGEEVLAKYVICGAGRAGADWFYQESKRLGLEGSNNPVDIGVRVEVPAAIMEDITSVIYESKLIYFTNKFDDRVRTFCMNPNGVVVTENYDGLVTVNGHSYAESKSENTNFAILVSKSFTKPFREPVRYGKYIASLANMLGEGVIVQRLGDLLMGRRSTPERIQRGFINPTLQKATPGDLSLVLPYRYMVGIIEMIEALDRMVPGIKSRHTLLYGVEVKFYSYRYPVNASMETSISNLYMVGDGSGVTRGLIQSSVAGTIAARDIRRQIEGL